MPGTCSSSPSPVSWLHLTMLLLLPLVCLSGTCSPTLSLYSPEHVCTSPRLPCSNVHVGSALVFMFQLLVHTWCPCSWFLVLVCMLMVCTVPFSITLVAILGTTNWGLPCSKHHTSWVNTRGRLDSSLQYSQGQSRCGYKNQHLCQELLLYVKI